MANIYWTGKKAPKKETREALMGLLVDNTPNRFTVRFDSDDGGGHVVAIIERNPGESCDGLSPYDNWQDRPMKFMGWRVLYMHVPDGYIDVFFDADGNYKITAEA